MEEMFTGPIQVDLYEYRSFLEAMTTDKGKAIMLEVGGISSHDLEPLLLKSSNLQHNYSSEKLVSLHASITQRVFDTL